MLVSLIFKTHLEKRKRFRLWKVVKYAPQVISGRHDMKLGGASNDVIIMPIAESCTKHKNRLNSLQRYGICVQ
jgi:hypothetical protein